MLCLEKVYRHTVKILVEDLDQDNPCSPTLVPDKDFWQNVAVAIYSVCRSPDPDTSKQGVGCFQRIILCTTIESVPTEKWVAIAYLIVNKQPPLLAEVSRGNACTILGQLLTRIMPAICLDDEYREDLEDMVGQFAALAKENLQQNRRGSVFKRTLLTNTYVSNHLASDEWDDRRPFGSWARETLFRALERVRDLEKPTNTANAKEVEDVSEISDSAAEEEQ